MAKESIESSLIAALGESRVFTSPERLGQYAASIHGSQCLPLAIVKPTSEQQVITLVSLATAYRFSIFPVSRGKNLGYGDAQGTSAGQVILDLSDLNGILEVDDKLCFATIQPGVSQRQLYEHIKANKLNIRMDVTGAGLEASIAGNVLERGFGHTDYGDRFARVISLRVVLMNGTVLCTGFSGHDNADAANTYRYGLGPTLEGLFSQSNFGIITAMTIEMMPVPEKTVMFALSAVRNSDINGIIDAIRELKLNGVVNSAVHIANKSRAVGSGKGRMLGAWNLSGSIAGPAPLVRARKKLVRQAFRKHLHGHRLAFLEDWSIRFLGWINRTITPLSFYPPLHEVFQEQNGIPTDDPLKTLLDDRNAASATISVADYPVCFSWINAVCKADPNSISKVIALLEDVFQQHGYEFRVTMTAVNPRTFILISNITYPREDASIEKAKAFKHACYALLNENGFLPYRSGSGMFDDLPEYADVHKELLRQLKAVFDPLNLLAPGKYNIE
jgi:4-cresol dehydrogenase (hydroxylating)